MDKNFKSGCLPPAKKSSSNKIGSQMEQQQQNNWKETYLRFIHNMEQDKTCSLFGKIVSNGKWHFFTKNLVTKQLKNIVLSDSLSLQFSCKT